MYGFPSYGYGIDMNRFNYLQNANNTQFPVQQSLGQQQNTFNPQSVVQVSGENGAKAYSLPPNSSVLLMDTTDAIVWLKSTDGGGYPTLTPFRITPIETTPIIPTTATAVPQIDIDSINNRLTKLEGIINEQSNNGFIKQGSKHNKQDNKQSASDVTAV